jgi:hypothetical protein
MKSSCIRYSDNTYSPLGSLFAWYVGDTHAQRIGKWLNLYCWLFRVDPTRFHLQYPNQ